MLVLRRKKDEKIIVKVPGMDDIQIMLCDIDRRTAQIGVSAPPQCDIKRDPE